MKPIRTAIVFAVFLAASVSAGRAHPGGHGEDEHRTPVITADVATAIAKTEVKRLVDSRQIDASWETCDLHAVERVYRESEMQFFATFHNKAAKGATELFVVVANGGDVSARGLAIEQNAAKARAREELKKLAASGRIPASWRDADPTSIEKRPSGSHWQWVATFDDQAQPEHKQVFLFLSPYGEFVATNYSGK